MITNANELQDAIARQGVSLAELARHLDVRHDVVSKMKTGKRRINAEESRRLTAFFAAMEDPKSDGFALDSIEDAIADIAAGKLIVVVDDADRENEGDLVMAASRVTTEAMAMMIRAGGLVCAPVTAENAVRLRLNPMAQNNDAPLATAFTVSIDYREGLTTGISAHERANTVRALSNNNVQAEDFVRPGHIFPLVAKDGGVLIRSGHTEAAVDLAHLAGEPPAGLICEILGEDGATLKGEGLAEYARVNGLKMVSIADLIAYRQQREQLVTRLSEFETQTRIGAAQAHIYSTPFDAEQHIAMVFGTPDPASPVLVRLHRETPLEDVFGSSGSSIGGLPARACGWRDADFGRMGGRDRIRASTANKLARSGPWGSNFARFGDPVDQIAVIARTAICGVERFWDRDR